MVRMRLLERVLLMWHLLLGPVDGGRVEETPGGRVPPSELNLAPFEHVPCDGRRRRESAAVPVAIAVKDYCCRRREATAVDADLARLSAAVCPRLTSWCA